MKVYGIGGLGVDERVFSALTLDFEIIPLKWIDVHNDESLDEYIGRFAQQIDSSTPFMIIGISFGGIVAQELDKIVSPEQTILISSATAKREIPWIYRTIGKMGVFKFAPVFLMKPPPFLANWLFGVKDAKYKKILKQIIANTDVKFLKWASDKIAKWSPTTKPQKLQRIHGTRDRMLHLSQPNDNTTMIEGGGHFIVMTRAEEISKILNRSYHIFK